MAEKIKKPLSKGEREKIKKTKIRVVGIGGGGGNIVSELAQRIKKASFFVANTDLQALKEISKKVKIFPFGQNLTQGLGTGMNPELAEIAAQQEKERIKKLLEGQDLIILVASLGGGAGSGALPVFAKISKSLGNLTYGIFTLPFEFEGEKKKEIARVSLEKIKSKLNTLTIIPNERIFQIIERTRPLKEALSFINKSLALSLGSLIEIIYQPGLINIDFADLKTILEGRGRFAYLNTVEAPLTEQETEIIKKVLNNPLYPYTVKGARGVLFNISGEKELLLSEVSQISKVISQSVNPEAKIIFGLSQAKIYQSVGYQFAPAKAGRDIIKVTLLATGCGFRISEKKIKPIISKKRKKIKPKKSPAKIFAEKTLEPKKEPLLKIKPDEKKPFLQKSKKKAKRTKIKVKISKEPEVKKSSQAEDKKKMSSSPSQVKENKFSSPPFAIVRETEEKVEAPKESRWLPPGQVKVRKNALQIKKEIEEAEKEILEKEKFWETPAFLRRRLGKNRKNRDEYIFL